MNNDQKQPLTPESVSYTSIESMFSLPLRWRLEVGTGRAGMAEGRHNIYWVPFVPDPASGAQDSQLFTVCFTIFFFFLIYFLFGEQLLYSIMLVSVLQQHLSAIIIFISLPSGTSHPIPSTPLGHHRVPGWTPVLYSSFALALCFMYKSVC